MNFEHRSGEKNENKPKSQVAKNKPKYSINKQLSGPANNSQKNKPNLLLKILSFERKIDNTKLNLLCKTKPICASPAPTLRRFPLVQHQKVWCCGKVGAADI